MFLLHCMIFKQIKHIHLFIYHTLPVKTFQILFSGFLNFFHVCFSQSVEWKHARACSYIIIIQNTSTNLSLSLPFLCSPQFLLATILLSMCVRSTLCIHNMNEVTGYFSLCGYLILLNIMISSSTHAVPNNWISISFEAG